MLYVDFELEKSFSIFIDSSDDEISITLLLALNMQTHGEFFG